MSGRIFRTKSFKHSVPISVLSNALYSKRMHQSMSSSSFHVIQLRHIHAAAKILVELVDPKSLKALKEHFHSNIMMFVHSTKLNFNRRWNLCKITVIKRVWNGKEKRRVEQRVIELIRRRHEDSVIRNSNAYRYMIMTNTEISHAVHHYSTQKNWLPYEMDSVYSWKFPLCSLSLSRAPSFPVYNFRQLWLMKSNGQIFYMKCDERGRKQWKTDTILCNVAWWIFTWMRSWSVGWKSKYNVNISA